MSPRWLVPVLAANTALSVTAVALWLFAPHGYATHAPLSPAVSAPRGTAAAPPASFARLASALQALPTAGPASAPPARGGDDREVAPALAPGPIARGNGQLVLPAKGSLADRLHLNPRVLAEIGAPNGELSPESSARLERGFTIGRELAERLGLDATRTQSMTALFTNAVFLLLRDERRALPGRVDPARIQETVESTEADVRTLCGEAAAVEALRVLPRL